MKRSVKRAINRLDHFILQQQKEVDRVSEIRDELKASLTVPESATLTSEPDKKRFTSDRGVSSMASSDRIQPPPFLTASSSARNDV